MTARHHREEEAGIQTDRQAQARLERMLAARHAAEKLRLARYHSSRTPRSQFRADVKASGRDMRLAPTPRRTAKRFTWHDLSTFLLPATLVAAMVLLAHWAGWLS